jgi:hypothetical protein
LVEAAFELSKLLYILAVRILDEKAKRKALGDYDPDDEATQLEASEEQAKIDATARNIAEAAWKPLLTKWRKRRPLIEMLGQAAKHSKLIKPAKTAFRKHMHYVPQSTTKQWASEKSGKFTVYKIGVDGEVKAEASTAKLWGAAPSLYTQSLEHLLGLIEGDVRQPYEKLVNIVPLDAMDTRRWFAFLIAQLIRTPRFMGAVLRHQKAWIESTGFKYPKNPAHLGQAYETLFTNKDLYAAYYRKITRRVWTVASAADGLTFLKGDNPVVISGRTKGDTWRLLYPLTPKRCFIAGPELEVELERIIPRQQVLTDAKTIAVNAATCNYADRTLWGKLFAQEKNLTTSAIARMNHFLHGASDFQVVRGDTLREPAFFSGDNLATFDCVIANPPFSLEKWGEEVWASDPNGRNFAEMPPGGSGDYAWVQHMIKSMAPATGRMAVILPHGASSQPKVVHSNWGY